MTMFNEFHKIQRSEMAKKAQAHLEQLRIRAGVGKQLEGLANDPQWKLYLDHVNALLEPKKQRLEVLKRQLLDEESPAARREYYRVSGEVEGLTSALSCARVAIESGKEASKELEVTND
jgi:hypothetical protein